MECEGGEWSEWLCWCAQPKEMRISIDFAAYNFHILGVHMYLYKMVPYCIL